MKLEYHKLLSTFALNFKLRRYSEVHERGVESDFLLMTIRDVVGRRRLTL